MQSRKFSLFRRAAPTGSMRTFRPRSTKKRVVVVDEHSVEEENFTETLVISSEYEHHTSSLSIGSTKV